LNVATFLSVNFKLKPLWERISFVTTFAIIVLFTQYSAYASIKSPLPLDDYYKQTWTTHDGLPHNSIHDLAQSSDGYLWIATWEGLVKFNGRKFAVFPRVSIAGLSSSGVLSLATNDDGRLIVTGARGGISERKNNHWVAQKPSGNMINAIIYDKKQGYWFSPEKAGLIYRNQHTQHDTIIIPKVTVSNILQDAYNQVWAATTTGLYLVDNKKQVKHFTLKDGLPNSRVYEIISTQNKQIIVGTAQGLYILKEDHFYPFIPALQHEAITGLFEDSNQDLWIGTIGKGLYRYSDLGLEHINDTDGLPNNRVSIIYQDNEGSIWVGTNSGLFRLREAPFITFTTKQGLLGNFVRTVLAHSDGSLWVGSSKGLNKIVQHKTSAILPVNTSKPSYILSLAEGKSGEVFAGSATQGVFKVAQGQLKPYLTVADGLPNNEIRSMLYDSKDNLWIGTAVGLVKRDKQGELHDFSKDNNLLDNYIMAITEDKKGRIWVGTRNGVVMYGQQDVKRYPIREQFDARFVFGLFVDGNIMWLATDRGLIKLNPSTGKMVIVKQENGLPVDKIFQILIDNERDFWLTSNRGIIRFNEYEIYKVISDTNSMIKYDLYREGDGLLSSQANGGSNPTASIHNDGSLWFSTAYGVSQVTRERLNRIADKKIPLVIEKVIVDGKEIDLPASGRLLLPAGSSRIAIYFAGIGFLMSEHIEYQTQLVGFDHSWLNKGNQTYSEFTNLPPGDYTFKMRAKYPNGIWHEKTVTLPFTIDAFFWQTPWFKWLVGILLVTLLYSLYRYRITRIKTNENKLKSLVNLQTLAIQKQKELFEFQASHDQLTGLHNRRAFDAWADVDFKQAQQQGNPLSLAILDIDYFKRVNDGYSHIIGDKAIQKVATLLKELADKSQYKIKIARWGGEEFTLLISADKNQAFEFCDYVRAKIETYDFSEISLGLKITVSIGLTDNQAVSDYEKMLCRADQALYYAKHHGRNQVRIFQKFVDDALCKTKARN
jgi:diguanylate cyclase (GGDEF)-like protein